MVITVDRFVHVFVYACKNSGILIYGTQHFFKPEFTSKIQALQILSRNEENDVGSEDDLEVILTSKKQSKMEKLAALIKSNRLKDETVKFAQ